jgi:hypothetical protein
MLKEIIASFCVFAVLLGSSSAVAGDATLNVIRPLAPPEQSAINKVADESLAEPSSLRQPESMLEMNDRQTRQMRRGAANFVGNRFYISDSCLNDATFNGHQDLPSYRLDYALAATMAIPGKWSHIAHGVSVESGIILGQAMCSAFIVKNAQHQVMVAGSVSVGVRGISDNSGRLVTKPIPNRVRLFYKSPADLQTALPQIKGFARFYIKGFDDYPPTFIETQYDLGRCGAGKSGKHIDVKTCPQQTRTLPVE